ncbi:MAG: ParB/RepB/Spo0J family partition protein [Muribaculaceae bacterium]|nr:ParB/RepB/Spo0J family partition protein [Muribaculaceae bacterium]
MIKRNALGRGLDSLISIKEVRTDGSSAISEIELDNIHPNPAQPRTTFDENALSELAVSIRELGVIQPLSLRRLDDGSYQIIAGERRWRAARMAGLKTVPAYIREASDTEVTEMALIENIQREDLNAIEVALAFRMLIDKYNLTQERLSARLGKTRVTIANHLRLLKLPAEIQLGLRDGKLEMGHARALLAVSDSKRQLDLYNRIVEEGLSVRRVEELARQAEEVSPEEPEKPVEEAPAADTGRYAEMSRRLSGWLPAPVRLKRRPDGKGSITVKFTSDEDLENLIAVRSRLDTQNPE